MKFQAFLGWALSSAMNLVMREFSARCVGHGKLGLECWAAKAVPAVPNHILISNHEKDVK